VNIVRAPRKAGFVIIPNKAIEDTTLSYRARGVLAYLLSRPDGWQTDSVRLADASPEGRDAIRTALRELETVGYLQRDREQNGAGQWVTVSRVFDEPRTDFQASGEPTPGNPNVGEPGDKPLAFKTGNKSAPLNARQRAAFESGQAVGCRAHGARRGACDECQRTGVGLDRVKPASDTAARSEAVRKALRGA
jgi:hypothetical protein